MGIVFFCVWRGGIPLEFSPQKTCSTQPPAGFWSKRHFQSAEKHETHFSRMPEDWGSVSHCRRLWTVVGPLIVYTLPPKKKIILRDLRELEMSMSQISAVAACEDRLPLIPRDGHAALLPAFHSAVLPMRARTRGAAGTLPFFIPFPREIRPKYCTLLFWHSQSIRAETFYPTTIWPNKFLALLPWPPHSAPAFVLLAAPLPRLRCARGWE
jgi:hypothetical protein